MQEKGSYFEQQVSTEEAQATIELEEKETGSRLTELEKVVFEALGQASMCWDPRPTGVFDSQMAVVVGDNLMREISTITGAGRGAEQQTKILADYLMRECPHEVVDGGAGTVAILVLEKYRKALRAILNKIGDPQPGYPQPNTYAIAKDALGPPADTFYEGTDLRSQITKEATTPKSKHLNTKEELK